MNVGESSGLRWGLRDLWEGDKMEYLMWTMLKDGRITDSS